MTAAHELAIRGFEVYVYESAQALDSRGYKSLAIGGLARTQYFQAPLLQKSSWEISFHHEKKKLEASKRDASSGVDVRMPEVPDMGGSEQARPFPSLWLEFLEDQENPDNHQLTQRSNTDLSISLEILTSTLEDPTAAERLGDFAIHVQPFYDQELAAIQTQQEQNGPKGEFSKSNEFKRAVDRAKVIEEKVKNHLTSQMCHRPKSVYCADPQPANTDYGQPPTGRSWVRVVLERRLLPGEHGFRYFPSYYRHIFDTMRRIPVYDQNSRPTPHTTYDNLVALPTLAIASEKAPPFIMNWQPYRFPDTIARKEREARNFFGELKITPRDILQFSLRVLRYMLTCPERRSRELENVSWWDYLEGYNPTTRARMYRYSEAFTHLVQSSGRVLVALDGKWADARTTGNTYAQLLTDVLVPTDRTHATLNGPTSEAWFSHWHTHLRHLGVRFLHGTLEGFRQVGSVHGPSQRFEPVVKMDSGESAPQMTSDAYYVVAVDVLAAEVLTQQLPCIGVPGQLQGYTTRVPACPGQPGTIERDPREKPGLFGWDRLQTLSGIQYFFDTELNLINGYLYLVDAPWGISAICSPIAWQFRPILGQHRYQSLLSVDIGEWKEWKKGCQPSTGKAAWDSTPLELGQETWRQLLTSLNTRKDQHPFLHFHFQPPEPVVVHIDEGLVFDDSDPGKARLICNNTPFLLPTVGDWQYRPGPEPWNPTPGTRLPPRIEPSPGVWQAPHGGYCVHWGQIVFAGTYNKTFTRLTTMESANESARHAVNAILDHCSQREGKPVDEGKPVGSTETHPYEELFPTTPLGDYCRIWDPEDNELPDLMLLRRQDAFNFAHHLPHPWDMLGVEVLPSIISQLWGGWSPASPASTTPLDLFTQVEALLRELGKQAGPGGGEGLLELLRRIRIHLEESLRRGAAGYQPPTP
jgi:hypothetical protein